MSAHSLLAPSSAYRWLTGGCPGSVAAIAGLDVVDTSSVYADEGTAAHAVLEWCLSNKVNTDAFPFNHAYVTEVEVSWTEPDEWRNDFPVDDEMLGHVQTVIDQVHSHLPAGSEVAPERRVDYGAPLGLPEDVAFGTADATGRDFENATLHVHDLKYGASPSGIVYAGTPDEPNPQLSCYAIGVLAEEELLGNWQNVALHIHQPRLDHWDSVTMTVDELHAFGRRAVEAMEKALSGFNADGTAKTLDELDELRLLGSGPKNCQYCPVAAICPAVKRANRELVETYFDDMTDEDMPVEDVVDSLDVPTPESLAVLERFIAATKERIADQLHAGKKVPGWKLVNGRSGPRKWNDEKAVTKMLSESMRFRKEQMYDMKLISPAKAEKMLKESPKRWARLQEHVTQSPGKETPVSESDRREAIVHENVVDQFDEMETE